MAAEPGPEPDPHADSQAAGDVRGCVRLVVSHALSATAMGVPWPALMAMVWADTHDDTLLGLVGAGRLAPYLAFSWLAGAVGDRFPRLLVVGVSTLLRLGMLAACWVFMLGGHLMAACGAAALAVSVGTPAYPSAAAAVVDLVPARSAVPTRWLVTAEVSAFVVGPALGGLALGVSGPLAAGGAAVVMSALGCLIVPWTSPAASPPTLDSGFSGQIRVVVTNGVAVRGIVVVAAINAALGALGVGLLTLTLSWGAGERQFGMLTAALGFGSLAAPLVALLPIGRAGVRGWLLVLVGLLVGLAVAPSWSIALVPLVLFGAVATQAECAVTATIQSGVAAAARACALGVADTAMIAAGMAGAACGPVLQARLGGPAMIGTFDCGVGAGRGRRFPEPPASPRGIRLTRRRRRRRNPAVRDRCGAPRR